MQLFLHKDSKLSKPLWFGLAIFFLVFCSSPVKKYIRLQLYKQNPVIETAALGEHFVTHDVKDCLIADRVDQAKISVPVLFLNDSGPDFSSIFILPALISIAFLLFFDRKQLSGTVVRTRGVFGAPTHRYLLLRHIQV